MTEKKRPIKPRFRKMKVGESAIYPKDVEKTLRSSASFLKAEIGYHYAVVCRPTTVIVTRVK